MGQGLPVLVRSVLIALLSAAVLFSRQKGPTQQAGEKVDNSGPTTGPFGPIAVVKSSVSRARSTVRSRPAGLNRGDDRRAEIQRVAQDLFDFNEMARRALGQHWQALSPQERNEFVQLFTDVLNQFFRAIVERYSGERMAFVEDEVAEGYARDGRSLVSNYRGQFDSIARTSLVAQLLEQMRTEQSTRASELLKPALHERWAAGLVLGAALYGRRR